MQAEWRPRCVPSISTEPFPVVTSDVVYFGMMYLLLFLSQFPKFWFFFLEGGQMWNHRIPWL